MPRVTIDFSDQQHAELEEKAARAGLSVSDYLRDSALAGTPDAADADALRALHELLNARRAEAEAGQVTGATADEIKREARRRLGQ